MWKMIVKVLYVCLALFVAESVGQGLPGSNPCTWGPSYWCKAQENAIRCNATEYCNNHSWIVSPATKPPQDPPGSNPCTWGPSYWCQAKENAIRCNATEYCNNHSWIVSPATKPPKGPPGSNPCTWGPSYWCQARENAIRCNATEYCNNHSWIVSPATKPPKVQAGPLCQICQLIVPFLKPYVDSNKTEAEVKQDVEKVCNLLPASFKTECTTFINDNFDTIWELLKKDVDSGTICTQIHVCTTTKKVRGAGAPGPFCQICQIAVQFVKPYIDSNATEKEAKEALDEVCSLLPSTYASQCTSYVDKNFAAIWNLLRKDVDSGTLCQVIGVCATVPVNKAGAPGPFCQVCKIIVPFLKPFIDSNFTEYQAKDALDELCSFLPSSEAQKCTNFADKNFIAIWNLLRKDADNGTLCKDINVCAVPPVKKVQQRVKAGPLCQICELVIAFMKPYMNKNSTYEEVKKAVEEVCKLLPSSASQECTSFVNTYFDKLWAALTNSIDNGTLCLSLCNNTTALVETSDDVKELSPLCVICEFVMNELEKILVKNSTEADIEAALDKVCSFLPSTLKTECTDFVNKYGPEIAELLLKAVSPTAVCTLLTLCAGEEVSMVKPVQVVNAGPEGSGPWREQAVDAGPQCALCELVMKEVENLIQQNSTEAEIEAALDKVCGFLPGTLKNDCIALVKQYAPQIINLLITKASPSEICTLIGLCSNSTSPVAMVKSIKAVDAGPQCALCELVMKEVENLIQQNSTEAEIEAALDKVCGFLPGTLKNDCIALVKQYAPQIINLLINKASPSEICTLIGLCSNSTSPVAMVKSIKAVDAGPECAICEFVMKEVESLLGKNATEAEVEAALEKVCGFLPATIKDECDSFVQAYTPAIINLILQNVQPDEICSKIGLCTSSTVNLGATKPVPTKEKVVWFGGQLECELCEFVLKVFDSEMIKNSTEQEVLAELAKACALITDATIKDACTNMLVQYGTQIIKAIVSGLDPERTCAFLKICPGTKHMKQTPQDERVWTVVKN